MRHRAHKRDASDIGMSSSNSNVMSAKEKSPKSPIIHPKKIHLRFGRLRCGYGILLVACVVLVLVQAFQQTFYNVFSSWSNSILNVKNDARLHISINVDIFLQCHSQDEKWVRAAVDSILAQRHRTWKLYLSAPDASLQYYKTFHENIVPVPTMDTTEEQANTWDSRQQKARQTQAGNEDSPMLFLDHCEHLTSPSALTALFSVFNFSSRSPYAADFAYFDYQNNDNNEVIYNTPTFNAYHLFAQYINISTMPLSDLQPAEQIHHLTRPLTTSMVTTRRRVLQATPNTHKYPNLHRLVPRIQEHDNLSPVDVFWLRLSLQGFRGVRLELPLLKAQTLPSTTNAFTDEFFRNEWNRDMNPSAFAPGEHESFIDEHTSKPALDIRDLAAIHPSIATELAHFKRDHAPLVSVVIPYYNIPYAGWFHETLECLQSQTLTDFEVVIVDDGSKTDIAKGEIKRLQQLRTDSFKDEHRFSHIPIRIIRHATNLGLSSARNTGVRHALGSFVFFLDPDDLILSTALEKLVTKGLQVIDKEERVIGRWTGFVYSGTVHFHAEMRKHEDLEGFLKQVPKRSNITYAEYDARRLETENFLTSAALISKRRYVNIGGNCPLQLVSFWEDWDFWVRMSRLGGRGVLIKEPLFWYRRHMLGNSAKIKSKGDDGALKEIRKHNPQIGQEVAAKLFWDASSDAKNGKPPCYAMMEEQRVTTDSEVLSTITVQDIVAMHNKMFDDGRNVKESSILIQRNYVPKVAPHMLPFKPLQSASKPNVRPKSLLYIIPWMVPGGADFYDLHVLESFKLSGYHITLVTEREGAQHAWQSFFQKYVDEIWDLSTIAKTKEERDAVLDMLAETRGVSVMVVGRTVAGYEAVERWGLLRNTLPNNSRDQFFGSIKSVDIVHLWNHDDRTNWEWRSGRVARYLDRRVVISEDLKQYMVDVVGHGDRVLGVPEGGTRKLSEEEQDKLRVIYPPLDLSAWEKTSLGQKVLKSDSIEGLNEMMLHNPHILFIGRLDDQKDPLLWVDAASSVYKSIKFKDTSLQQIEPMFSMIGDGPLRAQVYKYLQTRHRELSQRTVLIGLVARDNVPSHLTRSWKTVLLITSKFDGVPIVLLEALGLGVPVVTMACGGTEEVIALITKMQDNGNHGDEVISVEDIPVRRTLFASVVYTGRRCELVAKEMAENHAFRESMTRVLSQEVQSWLEIIESAGIQGWKTRWNRASEVRRRFGTSNFHQVWTDMITDMVDDLK